MEENHKLIAKIQHFYEVMNARIAEVEFRNITNNTDKITPQELVDLSNEYKRVFERVFEQFLYTEPQ